MHAFLVQISGKNAERNKELKLIVYPINEFDLQEFLCYYYISVKNSNVTSVRYSCKNSWEISESSELIIAQNKTDKTS